MEQQTMADSSRKPILPADQQPGKVQAKAERRQLRWRYLFSIGLIVSTVAAATMIAHWMRSTP